MSDKPLESIQDKVTQEVLFEIFPFVKIRKYDGWQYWIENCEGEGLPIQKTVLVAMLLKWIRENI